MRRSARDTLMMPVATVVTSLWAVAGFAALYTGKTDVFLIATGPFGGVIGFVFYKWAGNGNGGTDGKTPNAEP